MKGFGIFLFVIFWLILLFICPVLAILIGLAGAGVLILGGSQ